jgi:glycosyltransferase involved in cell wall biosynthesis
MKIAEIAPPWIAVPPQGYGGIELVVHELASRLHARGHDVTLFAPEGSTAPCEIVSLLPPTGPDAIGNGMVEAIHAVGSHLAAGSFDVVHDHTLMGPGLAAVSGAVPCVHTLHGPWTEHSALYYGLLADRVHLVAISESQRRGNPAIPYAATIPNGIDLDRYPLAAGPREDFLLYIGRATPDKAPELAVELARRADLPLTLVVKRGEPQEREHWERHVEPLLRDCDVALEGISHEEKVDLLRRARAFVFPIQWEEPFGLVVAEALACGLPVVATPRGAVAELVDDGVTGFLRADLEGLAAALGDVDRISPEACRAAVEARYSAEAMTDGYERLFRAVAAGAGVPAGAGVAAAAA